MQIPFLDLVAQHAPLREELGRVFDAALDTAAFAGGPEVAAFEREFARYLEAGHAIGVANGTDALRLALVAMGVGSDDIVLTVPNTFIATTEAISQSGARFDFVDVDPDTCLMDPNRVEDHLRRTFGSAPARARPSVLLPVHLYGQCADMDPLMQLASRYELKVLEDAAQAHGASYKGRKAGTLGHAAAFSFYPGKNLGACGEAGAVTTGDAGIAERLAMLRDHGQRAKYVHALEGWNSRMDGIQGAVLRVKLRCLEQWNEARRRWAAIYDAAFAPCRAVRPVRMRPEGASCRHLYVVHVADRSRLQEHLRARGIGTGLHYPIPLHRQECYSHLGLGPGSFPNAERSAAELLSLPMFAELGEERARFVTTCVLQALAA